MRVYLVRDHQSPKAFFTEEEASQWGEVTSIEVDKESWANFFLTIAVKVIEWADKERLLDKEEFTKWVAYEDTKSDS